MCRGDNTQLVTEVTLSIDIGSDPHLAQALCRVFNNHGSVPIETLDASQITRMLMKLEPVSSFDDHYIGEFVAHAAKRQPDAVIRMFLNRIDQHTTSEDFRSQPIPFSGFPTFSGLTQSEEGLDALRAIRDRSIGDSTEAIFWAPRLFQVASGSYDLASLKILSEWVEVDDANQLNGVGRLLREAPREFVFKNKDFTVRLLDEAHRRGQDCYDRVVSNLYCSAISGFKETMPGHPFPEDEYLRDQASEIATELRLGSPSRRFYEALAQSATATIRADMERYEEEDF